jgi:hypothetical protein
MIPTCMRSLVVSFVLLVAGSAFAQELGLRSFPVPEHGAFKLQVPKSWKDKVSPTAGSTAPTITFTGSGQEKFEMLLTPTWRTWPANPRAAAAEIWLLVQQNAERLKPKAVEKELPPQEISGASSAGYYISVTDPAPKPGEYKYLMQGTVRVGELLVRFTVLTNDGGDSIRRQALALVQSATHASEEASSSPAGAGTDRPDAIQITQTSTHYALTVPASRLVMQFPKGTFSPADRDTGGATSSPRYFSFKDRDLPFIVSGWFEPAKGFAGIQDFWAKETAQWNKQLPPPQNVAISKNGGWEVVAYEIPVPNLTNSHVRAHWVQAGTWIDLHLSLTNRQPASQARALLVAFLGVVNVNEKK